MSDRGTGGNPITTRRARDAEVIPLWGDAMPLTIVFDSDEGGLVHYPVDSDAVPSTGPWSTIVTTLCGLSGIGRVKERRAANCVPCRTCAEQYKP